MKLRTALSGVCAAAILLATAADAQSRREMLNELDRNRDGKIQFEELQAFRARAFDRFDTNGNGIADPAELSALEQQARRSGRSGPVGLDPYASDANRDGVITRQEFAGYIPARTLNADRNGDGALSRSEMRALR